MPNIKKTQNFGLNQWEPDDPVLREDFNADNLAVEQALGGHAARMAALAGQMEAGFYNTYQLALQNYYDKKQTGFKKAMVFDGFLSGDLAVAVTPGAYINKAAGQLEVVKTAAAGKTASFSYSAGSAGESTDRCAVIQSSAAASFTPEGWGYLNAVTLRMYSKGGNAMKARVSLLEGAAVRATSEEITVSNAYYQDITVTFSDPPLLRAMSTHKIEISTAGNSFQYLLASAMSGGGGPFGFSYTATPAHYTTGAMESVPFAMEEGWEKLLLWVRHNGAVVPKIKCGAGAWTSPVKTEARQAVNLQGVSCTESAYVLEGPAAAGPVAFLLALDAGEGACAVYDYGVIFL